MRLIIKDMDIATGDVPVAILNEHDACLLDLHSMDRILVKKGRQECICILDIAESKKAVPPGRIGLFEEALHCLGAKHKDPVTISLAQKPISVSMIRRKLDGHELHFAEVLAIVKDIVEDKLSRIELTSYITATYTHGMSNHEMIDLSKAMIATGDRLKLPYKPVVDLHGIGGVPGNRTTMVVVPIVAAAGFVMPKTATRAITSPAGTADTMEVLAPVSHTLSELKKILKKVGAFIVWGGALNLAPADDKIIRVENPLGIDAEGQMVASIMAKKASVGSTDMLLEIPYGKGCKPQTLRDARHLEDHFNMVSKELNVACKCWSVPANEPIGNGIGPILEARDCLWVLKRDPKAPLDLRDKSLKMAGILLEFLGKARPNKGIKMAKDLLNSGAAYKKMLDIIRAQGGHEMNPKDLYPAARAHHVRAARSGTVRTIDNMVIAKLGRLSGAPRDPGAGLYLYKHLGDKVKKGEILFSIYSPSHDKLGFAVDFWRKNKGVVVR